MSQAVRPEPQPGDVGYPVQGRIGDW